MNQAFFDHLFYRWLVTTGRLDEALDGRVPNETIAIEFACFISWPAGTSRSVDDLLDLFPGSPEVLGKMKVGALTVRLSNRYEKKLENYLERERGQW